MSKLKRKPYEALLEPLEEELVSMSRWVAETGQRVLVLFEGRDTAGKGGAINAIADRLNPRQCHVVALSKPSEDERKQWFFQRYAAHLPGAGEITLFDRSWYNRAGVEKVMGFATHEQVGDFLDAVPAFEKMLVDDGILLFAPHSSPIRWGAGDGIESAQRIGFHLTGLVNLGDDRRGGFHTPAHCAENEFQVSGGQFDAELLERVVDAVAKNIVILK